MERKRLTSWEILLSADTEFDGIKEAEGLDSPFIKSLLRKGRWIYFSRDIPFTEASLVELFGSVMDDDVKPEFFDYLDTLSVDALSLYSDESVLYDVFIEYVMSRYRRGQLSLNHESVPVVVATIRLILEGDVNYEEVKDNSNSVVLKAAFGYIECGEVSESLGMHILAVAEVSRERLEEFITKYIECGGKCEELVESLTGLFAGVRGRMHPVLELHVPANLLYAVLYAIGRLCPYTLSEYDTDLLSEEGQFLLTVMEDNINDEV